MSKRVSVKGQGADIFFGEGQDRLAPGERGSPAASPHDPRKDESGDEATSTRVPGSVPPSKAAPEAAGQRASMHPGQHASMQARTLPSLAREAAGTLSASTRRRLRDLLGRDHRSHNSYRYNEEELAAVRDIVYELEVRWRAKVTRNDVMRAAVIWAIEDFKERRKDSFLAQLFREGD